MPSEPRFLDRSTPPCMFTLIALTSLSALAMNFFLPSLPGMAEHFNADYSLVQLSVGVYLGISAVMQLFVGPLSDRFGRRPILLAGISVFALATLGCMVSTNIWVFLFFRMVQAAVAAAMILPRAAVRDMLPEAQAASMIGYVTMGMALVPMVGPAVGGVIEVRFGWQAVFLTLLATGLAALALAWADFGETAPSRGASWRSQISGYPELLSSPRFWGYATTLGLSSGSFFAYLGGAPYVGETFFGLAPDELGLFFGAPAIGYAVGNYLSGRLSVRIGVNRMAYWGCLITASSGFVNIGLFEAGLGGVWTFFGLITFIGVGNGMTIPNGMAGALSVRPHLAGTASGLAGFLMFSLGATLSALSGSVLTSGSGPEPLLWIMAGTAVAAIVPIRMVIARARRIGIG